VEALLGTPLTKIYEGNAAALRVLGVVAEEGFQLRKRAAHVWGEAERVTEFKATCEVCVCVGGGVLWGGEACFGSGVGHQRSLVSGGR
jgi:hypothetical protein